MRTAAERSFASWLGSADVGPLSGVKILEFGSIGPGPFASMLLANMGADVIRLRRPGEPTPITIAGSGADHHGRPAVSADLKSDLGRELALTLAESADAVIEGNRPGVMERLGLGPVELLERNPRLVYGRITGYGQDGPLSSVPGHDINYIAISGVLGAIGRQNERPLFPINLLGDYGGGGMLLAFGILAGLIEARRSGSGQVVDASMVDGVAQLATIIFSFAEAGSWGEPGTNVLDSGAHFYEVYETADGLHMAVGALEPKFYAELLRLLEIDADQAPQWDRTRWADLKQHFADIFRSRTRDQWTAIFETEDACVTPVLAPAEAVTHPHNVARQAFVQRGGSLLPRSAPRFSGTPADDARQVPRPEQALASWGLSEHYIESLRTSGAFD
jgi:alpha-methylacyl-CoA racemase